MAFRWEEMIEWMKRGCQKDGWFQDRLDKRLAYIGILDIALLDDIGQESGMNPDHSRVLLRSIVNRAQAREHSLIITSNLTPQAFAGYADAATLSRMSNWGETIYEPAGKKDLRCK
jgi:DNA replication protein DnaC